MSSSSFASPTVNNIGNWNWDSAELPQYEYKGGQPFPARDKLGHDDQLPEDPCFILGNYRMTLYAHASGRYQFITGERGWARLNQSAKNEGWNQSLLHVKKIGGAAATEETTYALTEIKKANRISAQPRFGVGYAQYDYNCADEVIIKK